MKILFLIHSLKMGGAERSACEIAGWLATRANVQVHFITFDPIEDFYDLANTVARIRLDFSRRRGGMWGSVSRYLSRMRELRATISRLNPDVVLSFLVNANIMACLTRLGMCHKLMISEQTDPKSYALNEPWLTIRRLSYPVADHLVCVSRGVSDGFGWLPEERRTVIYNPINDSWFRSVFDFERPKVIGGMGRLIGRKGFNHLISAFSAIAERHPEWSLQIAGEGAERRNLEAQIASLGRVGDRIKLIGPVDDPPEFFSRIGIFVLPSLFEGFGNVLIEAMACGVPVVSFNCNFGPAEIIDDPEVGSLVAAGDVDALADEISSLIRNEKLRTKRAEAAYQSVLQRFSLNRIGGQWLDLCERLLAE